MLSIYKLLPGGRGLAPVLVKRAARVVLDWDVRQKSRFDATDSQGRALGVFLARGTCARGGDVLVAEDGSLIVVEAAPRRVLRVTACAEHGTPFDLLRAAYHLGNRHVALELRPEHLQLEPDHVLADLLRRMHLIVNEVEAPFEPETGAYAPGAPAAHAHALSDVHAQARTREHEHPHAHDHVDHDHAPDHDHGHGHGHDHGSPGSPAPPPGTTP